MTTASLLLGDAAGNALHGTAGPDAIYGFDPRAPAHAVTRIDALRVASGLDQPLFASSPRGDAHRLFVVEKTGRVKILDMARGAVLETPFLDVSADIRTASEQGLLGLAFDPDYARSGLFYVNLVNLEGDTEIRRYRRSNEEDRADAASAETVLVVDQPAAFGNHKAGWLGFGADGLLYAALGDGGGSGDPLRSAQNADALLGKILRLDVRADGFPADAARDYAIPADNPFVGGVGSDEVWALGLRNPWRASFDRATGELYIADVGQDRWEEIDLGRAGANYGWNLMEGPEAFAAVTPGPGALTAPIHSYGRDAGGSITGGYVYRGPGVGLHGEYVYGDFVSERIFSLRFDGTGWLAADRTAQVVPDAGTIDAIASFGEDGEGRLYVVDLGGEIFRLTPRAAGADDAADALDGQGGDDFLFAGPGDDMLVGGAGDDELHGEDGRDVLAGGAGDDVLFGGPGTDTAIFGAARDAHSVLRDGPGFRVTGPDGLDVAYGIERAHFSDRKYALDVGPDEPAGRTVKLIGAAFGADAVAAHPEWVGAGLRLFDAGYSPLAVAEIAVASPAFAARAGGTSVEAFVETIYANVAGRPPSDDERTFYSAEVQSGAATRAGLLLFAAELEATAVRVGLAGLQDAGVVFA